MIIKIVLDKAYDGLEWEFIKSTLEDVGLPRMMIKVTMECITNGSFCLLWNKELTDPMRSTCETWQGDPSLCAALCFACRYLHIISIGESKQSVGGPLKHHVVGQKFHIYSL